MSEVLDHEWVEGEDDDGRCGHVCGIHITDHHAEARAQPDLAALRAATDIRLLANAILGGTTYQPLREAAERVLALLSDDAAGGT